MEDAELSNVARCLLKPSAALSRIPRHDAAPMTAYHGFRIFSHVVLGLMAAGIAYAAYIAITYWTGISV